MPIRILVADDDADILEVITALLTQEGYQTIACSNGLAALQQVHTKRPALAIIDLAMPVMDGKEVIRRIRQGTGPYLPIILMTASIHVPTLETLQVDAYLAKPFDLEELLAHVLNLVGPPEDNAAVNVAPSVPVRFPGREGPSLRH